MRPTAITIDRAGGTLHMNWADGLEGTFPLRWLRANCPCATCREERRAAEADRDELTLTMGPPPSTEIRHAALVGNYAVRLEWTDGHDTGMFAFSALRAIAGAATVEDAELPPLDLI